MKLAIDGDQILIADPGPHFQTLKSMGMLWAPKRKLLLGVVNLELVERLCKAFPAPAELVDLRQRLRRRQSMIDAERMAEEPRPLVDYPVRAKMFAHQIRGANMALLAFGIIDKEVEE